MTLPEEDVTNPPDLEAIWNLLRAIDLKISTHIAEEDVNKPKVIALLEVFSQAKGAIVFVKWMAALAAASAAAWGYASTHITWR